MKKIYNRIISIYLVIVIFLSSIQIPVFASEYENTLNGWKVEVSYNDNSKDYIWNSTYDEQKTITIRATYRIEQSEKDYKKGDIQFKIPGIGNINRKTIVEAFKLPGDNDDSEWSYTWDPINDIYTFTNEFEVKAGESISGGFEFSYQLNARDCMNGYEQEKSPQFFVSGSGSVLLEPLSMQFTSLKDKYRIHLYRDTISETDYDNVDKNYIWYDIRTNFDRDILARGLYKSDYFISIELPDETNYKDMIILYDNEEIELQKTENGYGFYLFKDHYNEIEDEISFRIGLKKETLIGSEILITGHLDRLYQDESEWITTAFEDEKVDDELIFTTDDYSFVYHGTRFSLDKVNDHEANDHSSPDDYSDRLQSSSLYNRHIIHFTLTGSSERSYSSSRMRKSKAFATSSNALAATPSNYQILNSNQEDLGENDYFNMIIGDDKLAIFTKIGSIRNLEDDEYDFSYIYIENDNKNYDYTVYGAINQDTSFEDYEEIESGNTKQAKTIVFPDEIKAFYVVFKDIYGTYKKDIDVGLRVHLDYDKESLKDESDQADGENRIVNFSYLRAVGINDDGENVDYTEVPEESYSGSYGEILKDRDYDLYNMYLMRDFSNVWLRSPITNMEIDTEMKSFSGTYEEGFTSTICSDAELKTDYEGVLTNFSIYTVLPYGTESDFDSDDIIIKGSAKNQNDDEITNFIDYVNFSLTELNGQTVLVSNFDFTDNPINSNKLVKASVEFPIFLSSSNYIDYGNKYTASSYLMIHDDGYEKFSGPAIEEDQYDLDNNGITTDKLAYSSDSKNIEDSIFEWREYTSKDVKSFYSDSYKKEAVVKIYSDNSSINESLYSYRLNFNLGSSNAKNIIFYDNLEQVNKTEKSEWNGTFQSIDTSYAEEKGYIPTIYYSTKTNASHILNDDWTTVKPENNKNIKSIAVQLDTSNLENGVMKEKESVYVIVNMLAPSEKNFVNKTAINEFECSYDIYDNGVFENTYTLPSDYAYVKLLDSVGSVTLQKIDSQTGKTLTGAKFQIYDKNYTPLFEEPIEVNAVGRIELNDLPFGTYYYEEIESPLGYEKLSGKHEFKIDGITEIVNIKNEYQKGTVTLTKIDSQTQEKLKGAEFELFDQEGLQIFTDENYEYNEDGKISTFITDEDGKITLTGLPWNSYYFVETKAPKGYIRSNDEIHFSIIKSDTDIKLTASNNQKSSDIKLIKVDSEDGSYLKNAYYNLYRKTNNEWKLYKQNLKTNAAGEIIVSDLPFGEYRFEETQPPDGYVLSDQDPIVKISAENAGTIIEIEHENERKTGSVQLIKTSKEGNPLQGAVFDLYESGSNQLIKSNLVTDENGKTNVIENLEWKKYYFIETKAPEGYELKEDPIYFTIDSSNTDYTLEITTTNEEKTGSVILTKLDEETRKIPLKDAVFNLYKTDGTLIKENLKTDEDGKVYVSDLPWDSYYFEEIEAPNGYGLYEGKIRFTVNRENCETIQNLTCYDPIDQVQIRINKEIDESYRPYGDSTFVFKISGNDINGDYHEWFRSITLNDKTNGFVTLTGIPAGEYRVEELQTNRYGLSEIISDKNFEINGSYGITDLTTEKEAEISFTNYLSHWEKFSHSVNLINIISAKNKITGIVSKYTGPDVIKSDTETTYTFKEDDISVSAFYDDGGQKEIPFNSLEITPKTVSGNYNTSGSDYLITVSYTEDGITVSDTFTVKIQLKVPEAEYSIRYHANGGYFGTNTEKILNEVTYQYNNGKNELILGEILIPNHQTEIFDGWFLNKECTIPFEFSETEKMTEDVDVYAKWKPFEASSVILEGQDLIEKLETIVSNKEQITSFERSETKPTGEDTIIISNQDSETPIYAWVENNELKYYTEATDIHTGTDLEGLFKGYESLVDISGLENWDISNVTSIDELFYNCYSLNDLTPLKKWDVSNIDSFSRVFWNCKNITNLSGLEDWNFSETVYTLQLFYGCEKLSDISQIANWNMENIESIDSMFYGCVSLTDITPLSNWNMQKLSNIAYTFNGSGVESLTPLSNWNIHLVYITGAFSECENLTSLNGIENFDITEVENINSLFSYCTNLVDIEAIENWNTENVENISELFKSCNSLSDMSPISNWNTNKISNLTESFKGTAIENVDFLTNWKIKPYSISWAFAECENLINLNGIKNIDVSNVSNLEGCFSKNSNLTNISALNNWDVSNVTNIGFLFRDCESLTDLSAISSWNVDRVTNIIYTFSGTNIYELNALSNWTPHPIDMTKTFAECENLISLNGIENFDVSNVKGYLGEKDEYLDGAPDTEVYKGGFYGLFEACKNLEDISALKDWNVSNVMSFGQLFNNCKKLKDLSPVENWNTSSVKSMDGMLAWCDMLTDLTPLQNWNTDSLESMEGTFAGIGCDSDLQVTLNGLEDWNVSNVKNMYMCFAYCWNFSDTSATNNWKLNEDCIFDKLFLEYPSTNILPSFTYLPGYFDSNGTYIPY